MLRSGDLGRRVLERCVIGEFDAFFFALLVSLMLFFLCFRCRKKMKRVERRGDLALIAAGERRLSTIAPLPASSSVRTSQSPSQSQGHHPPSFGRPTHSHSFSHSQSAARSSPTHNQNFTPIAARPRARTHSQSLVHPPSINPNPNSMLNNRLSPSVPKSASSITLIPPSSASNTPAHAAAPRSYTDRDRNHEGESPSRPAGDSVTRFPPRRKLPTPAAPAPENAVNASGDANGKNNANGNDPNGNNANSTTRSASTSISTSTSSTSPVSGRPPLRYVSPSLRSGSGSNSPIMVKREGSP